MVGPEAVKTNEGESDGFEVKVRMHQGSVLSPLLFIIVFEALSSEFRVGLPWELFYADDMFDCRDRGGVDGEN